MHRLVPGSLVIWYDAVTVEGKLQWQNELNRLNSPFFQACDGIFLNYTWKVLYWKIDYVVAIIVARLNSMCIVQTVQCMPYVCENASLRYISIFLRIHSLKASKIFSSTGAKIGEQRDQRGQSGQQPLSPGGGGVSEPAARRVRGSGRFRPRVLWRWRIQLWSGAGDNKVRLFLYAGNYTTFVYLYLQFNLKVR